MNADQATARRRTAPGLVAALVDSGIVSAEDRSRAVEIVERELGPAGEDAPRSRVLAEIAGYAGGILVVAAGAVFLAASWREMSLATRVGALLLGALVLAGAGLGARLTGRDTPEDADVRRRLAGAFGIGSAALATGALGTYIEHQHHTGDGWIALVFGAFTVLALGFYVLAPTVPGQAAVGFGVAATVLNATSGWSDGRTLIKTVILLALGIGWLALAELRWWREPETARVVGGALTLLGAETPVFEGRMQPLAYVLLALVGAVAFAAYVRVRAWPYLAIGVIGLTLAATQAAVDYLPGAAGAAAGLLVAGAMLLATSLLAMRLRKSAGESTHPTA